MTSSLPAAVGRAMAVQVNRTRQPSTDAERLREKDVEIARLTRELTAANREIERLNSVIEKQQASVVHSPTVNTDDSGLFINGRKVVNQVEAAKILGVKQYKISRWLKAGKFERVAVPGRKYRMIYADSLHKPERGQPGRKKK